MAKKEAAKKEATKKAPAKDSLDPNRLYCQLCEKKLGTVRGRKIHESTCKGKPAEVAAPPRIVASKELAPGPPSDEKIELVFETAQIEDGLKHLFRLMSKWGDDWEHWELDPVESAGAAKSLEQIKDALWPDEPSRNLIVGTATFALSAMILDRAIETRRKKRKSRADERGIPGADEHSGQSGKGQNDPASVDAAQE